MARTALTPVVLPKQHDTALVAVTLTAIDNTNGNLFPATGREILLFNNPDAAPHTITILSQPDSRGRSSDITAFSLPATTYYVSQLFTTKGWIQADGNIYLTSNSALITVAVLRIPQPLL